MRTSATLLLCSAILAGCIGDISSTGEPMPGGNPSQPPVTKPPPSGFTPPSTDPLFAESAYGRSGSQRLTRRQLLAAAEAIFGVAVGSADTWAPSDSPSATYFENDYTALGISVQLVTDYESFATEYSHLVAADTATFAAKAGCTPTGPSDVACFRKYAERVGRRVFRRPIAAAESQAWADALMPWAQQDADFFSAIDALVAAWLQHPEFLYRVEKGDVTPGSFQPLDQYEIATRISFLATGLPPDDALLDAAKQNELSDDAQRLAQAERLLATNAGARQAQYFHSRWLGYADTFFPPALFDDAFAETRALVEKVSSDGQADWLTLFSAKETKLTPALATHYGLPQPQGASEWVSYPAGRGGGVLSHATVAVLGAKFGDTSPTLRGYEMLKRVYCGHLEGDIPPGVDIDDQPGSPGDCKPTRYFQRNNAACVQCHGITDNIGFGLENVGAYGQWRETEVGNAQCGIDGTGSVNGVAFKGPAELGQLMAEDPRVALCAGKQLFQMMTGRPTLVEDDETLQALQGQYYQARSYRSMVSALVKSPAITRRGAN